MLRAHFEESRGDLAVDGAGLREAARIERQLKTSDREIQRLIDAYQAAAITLEELQERRRQIDDHGRHLQARRDEINRQHSQREQELRLLQGLDAFCDGMRDKLTDPPFETRQSVLRLVIDQVIVEEDRLVIRHVVPTASIGLQPHLQQDTGPTSRSTCSAPPQSRGRVIIRQDAAGETNFMRSPWLREAAGREPSPTAAIIDS